MRADVKLRAGMAWIAVPLLLYAVLLVRLWADAPTWDDYGTVLAAVMRMMDASSVKEWLTVVV